MFLVQRPDQIVVDRETETCCVIEFKRKMDRYSGYREKKTDRAKSQYVSLKRGLEEATRKMVHLGIIVEGKCRSVHTKTFNDNKKLLG